MFKKKKSDPTFFLPPLVVSMTPKVTAEINNLFIINLEHLVETLSNILRSDTSDEMTFFQLSFCWNWWKVWVVLFDMGDIWKVCDSSLLILSLFTIHESILTKTKVAEILHLATGKQKTQKGCKSHPQICIEFIA